MLKHYSKIKCPYKREDGNPNKLTDIFADKTVEYLKDLEWIGSEKIDGTNTAIYWDGHRATIHGHTERTTWNPKAYSFLEGIWCASEMEEKIEELFGATEVIFYGETFGKLFNQSYGYDLGFAGFDVYFPTSDHYLSQEDMRDVYSKLGISLTASEMIRGTIEDIMEYVKMGDVSRIDGKTQIEGVICRPMVEMKDCNNQRVIVKIKRKDFR